MTASAERVEALVVGGGQAGLAMSEHLSASGVPHLVLERHRIAERWRSERWDSLVANGPAWHDRFPGLEFSDVDPDDFASKEQVAEYFVAYAEKIAAPIRCGVEVTSVRRNAGRPGFRAETSDGTIDARYVVAATGPFQRPVIPPIVPEDAGPVQIHSSGYRNPGQLPDGAVLVVGAGSSGVQIADELLRAGRQRLPLGRPARPAAAALSRPRLRAGGSASSASGTPRRRRRAPSTSRSRSAEPRRRHRRLPASSPARGMTLVGRTASFADGVDAVRAGPRRQHRAAATPTTCRCSTRPTPTSRATASTSRGAGGAHDRAGPGLRHRSRCSSSTWPAPA